MFFQPHRRLLTELVGSNLYPNQDVSIRELAQNAWDAIQWRRERGDGSGSRITVRFSASGNWFEVEDDGIGMNRFDVEQVLLQVGRDKLEALGVEAAPSDQVAYFGIGFLSVFLVAERVTIRTRKLGEATGLVVAIDGLDQPVSITEEPSDDIGTTIRVFVGQGSPFHVPDVPNAVRRYIRHVSGVRLIDIDNATETDVVGDWATQGAWSVAEVPPGDVVRSGRLGFSGGLRADGPISNAIVLSNAGFLVEERTLDLVPLGPTSGFTGELDLHPGRLAIVMARERFQRNEAWVALGNELLALFAERALDELRSGLLARSAGLDAPEVRRAILIWEATLPDHDLLRGLKEELRLRIWSTIGFGVADRTPRSLSEICTDLPQPRLYVRRLGAPSQTSRHIDDEGVPIQFTEEIRYSVRVGALRARGFPVAEVTQIHVTQEAASGASRLTVEEEQSVRRAAESHGVTVLDIGAALPEDLDLEAVEILPVLRSLLDVGHGLRFARVPESGRRVVTDPSGIRYLNVENPTVARLMNSIASAVANPLKRRLLEAYLAVEDYDTVTARTILLALLEHEDLPALAQADVAILTSRYIAEAVAALESQA